MHNDMYITHLVCNYVFEQCNVLPLITLEKHNTHVTTNQEYIIEGESI